MMNFIKNSRIGILSKPIQTKTMFLETTLFQYIKSKMICLIIGHSFSGGCGNEKYCGRCCDTRTEGN